MRSIYTLLGRPSVSRGQLQRYGSLAPTTWLLTQTSADCTHSDRGLARFHMERTPHRTLQKGLGKKQRKDPAVRLTPKWSLSRWLYESVSLMLASVPVITDSLPLLGVQTTSGSAQKAPRSGLMEFCPVQVEAFGCHHNGAVRTASQETVQGCPPGHSAAQAKT